MQNARADASVIAEKGLDERPCLRHGLKDAQAVASTWDDLEPLIGRRRRRVKRSGVVGDAHRLVF
jgi:hypothetical protein